MAYKYLHDLSIIELGKRYRFRLMPEKKVVTGTVILVEPNPENKCRGKIHTENDNARLYAGEYQYFQYNEYPDEPDITDLFSNLSEFKEFIEDIFYEGFGERYPTIGSNQKIEKIFKDWLEHKRIKL